MADQGERVSRARICIDFGTALSKASVCLDPDMPIESGIRPLAIGAVSGAEHHLLTPSVLFVDGGRLYFGPTAFGHAEEGIASNRDALLSFKTVLGADNVGEALNLKMRPSVDPTGTLRQRDALVLYLAYLDQLIREALAQSLGVPPETANARRRYTSPVWRRGSGVDRVFEGIFNEAAAVSAKLGKLLLSPEGISIAQCKDALDKAAANPGDGRLETGIFEPHAAAAASLAFTSMPTRFVIVFDMGAGTTDVAAFEFDETSDPPSIDEIKEARQCSALAGDEIDRILIELILKKRGGSRDDLDPRALRAMRLAAREMKKELFGTGKCAMKNGWLATTVKANELMEDPEFRQYLSNLAGIIAASLSVVAARADAQRGDIIDVVLAGGGSHLPFLPDLVKHAAQGRTGGVPLRVGALSPTNPLYDSIDPALGAAFAQIAMSVGGALVERLDPAA